MMKYKNEGDMPVTWITIKNGLFNDGLFTSIEKLCHSFNMQQLFNFRCSKMNDNLICFKKKFLFWLEPKLHHLGRCFHFSDFERDI